MKIKGCRGIFAFLLLVVITAGGIELAILHDNTKQNNGEYDTDNGMAEMIILSNPGNMPSSGTGMGF